MTCLARATVAFVVLLVAVAGAAALAARHAAGWLGAADAPAKADAIVVLGSEPTRAITAAELYRRGLASVVYLTVPVRLPRHVALEQEGVCWPWFEEAASTLLRNRGVPDDAIRLLGNDLLSTVSEARVAARVLGPEVRTLLVVTSPYHVYRTRLIFSDHLPGTRVLVVASGAETLPERWWADRESAVNVPLEFAKLLFYKLGFSFS
jgi:uncharacterized SAM-binding protein YcdF (DUF218 family)